MKNLKMSIALLLTVAFFTSCEKESTILPENSVLDNMEIINKNQSRSKTSQFQNSEFETSAVLNSKKSQNSLKPEDEGVSYSHYSENDLLEFHENSNSFLEYCSPVMQVEDFENPEVNYTQGYGNYGSYLDNMSDFSDNYGNGFQQFVEPGDIQENVQFSTVLESGELAWIWIHDSWPFTGHGNQTLTSRNWIGYADDLVIDFTKENVYAVSFGLFPDSSNDIKIEVFGALGLLGNSDVFGAYQGDYWGVHSQEPIKKIIISATSIYRLAIDNLNFGYCDADSDGFPDQVDAHPNSNMSEELSFDGCYPGVTNVLFSNGTTMADEVDDLIAEIWTKLNSDNVSRYYDAQKDFQREMTYLLAKWYRTDRVITDREKYNIVNCVRSSRIFKIES